MIIEIWSVDRKRQLNPVSGTVQPHGNLTAQSLKAETSIRIFDRLGVSTKILAFDERGEYYEHKPSESSYTCLGKQEKVIIDII
ncbi:hypothetical protein QUF75_01085 [Desulfococcaceae bacterium HSG7]|nr:hypothetical protein [Desulfococcaceae bacterium HSG7]